MKLPTNCVCKQITDIKLLQIQQYLEPFNYAKKLAVVYLKMLLAKCIY